MIIYTIKIEEQPNGELLVDRQSPPSMSTECEVKFAEQLVNLLEMTAAACGPKFKLTGGKEYN